MAGNKYSWEEPKEEKEYVLIIDDKTKLTGTANQLIRELIKQLRKN